MDHVIAASHSGDVVIIHPASVKIVARFSAHKLAQISHIVVDSDYCRLLTAAGSAVRVWDLSQAPFKLLEASSVGGTVTHATCLGGYFVVRFTQSAPPVAIWKV